MSKKELEPMLLLGGGETTTNKEDPYDYVLVMVNPYILQEGDALFDRTLTKVEAEELFLSYFRTRPDDHKTDPNTLRQDEDEEEDKLPDFIASLREKLNDFLASQGDEVRFSEFAILVLK